MTDVLPFFFWMASLANPQAQTSSPTAAAAPSFPRVSVGGLWYLSYQDGEKSDVRSSQFLVKRGYINVEAKILGYLSGRITPDVTQDSTGDVKVRLKYAYAKLSGKPLGFIHHPEVEFGIAHTPWLEFEERVNVYRMQDTLFMERNGLFNSADFGVTAMGLFGEALPEDYQKKVTPDFPGRYGSFAVGVYNGGGYHAAERNTNKALEGRLSVRPLPDVLPGFQVSYFGVTGKGNTPDRPDWDVNAVMASYEAERFVLTGTWVDATGNQQGNALSANGRSLDRTGWSIFAEGKLNRGFRVIARHDRWDPDRDSAADEEKRTILGLGYVLLRGNVLLIDYERLDFDRPGRPADQRFQATLQVRF